SRRATAPSPYVTSVSASSMARGMALRRPGAGCWTASKSPPLSDSGELQHVLIDGMVPGADVACRQRQVRHQVLEQREVVLVGIAVVMSQPTAGSGNAGQVMPRRRFEIGSVEATAGL